MCAPHSVRHFWHCPIDQFDNSFKLMDLSETKTNIANVLTLNDKKAQTRKRKLRL